MNLSKSLFDEKFCCPECKKIYKYKKSLNRHTNFCHKKQKLYCTDCESIFYTKKGLHIHLNKFHNKFFQCTLCNFTTNLKRNLNQHKTIHKPSKIYNCILCSFYTNSKSNLNRHTKTKHVSKKFFIKCPVRSL